MSNLTLTVKYRTDLSKSATKAIRRNNHATGTVYGHGVESIPIEVSLADLADLYKAMKDSGSSIIDLKVENAPTNCDGPVVLKTVTKNPISRKVIDVEFQRVSMAEKITLEVPVQFVGECPGLKAGGILEEVTTELRVRALPNQLPSHIEVDVSGLEVGHHINVSDLTVPEGVEILNDPDTTVASCVHPHKPAAAEEEAAETAEEAPAAE